MDCEFPFPIDRDVAGDDATTTTKKEPIVFFKPRHRYDCITALTILEDYTTPLAGNESRSLGQQQFTPWPTKTDVRCFHCHHSFTSVPIGIPIHCDVHSDKGVQKTVRYRCKGNFCSFECAKAGMMAEVFVERTVDPALLMLMRRDVFGVPIRNKDGTVNHINQAPPKELLRVYGGKKDIDAFRGYASSNDTVVASSMLVAINPIIYSGRRASSKKRKVTVPDSASVGTKRKRALRNQRVSNLINGTNVKKDGDLSSFF